MKRFIISFLTAVVLTTSNAYAKYTEIDPVTQTFKVAGKTTSVHIKPNFALTSVDGAVQVDVNADIDASDLRNNLISMMNKQWKYEECGQRLTTNNASIRPASDGRLIVSITGQAQQWKCAKFDVPRIRMVMKKIGFIKTKVPQTYMHRETAKTKLISQSLHIEAYVRPVIRGNTIYAEVDVTNAMPGGLAKSLVNGLGLHGFIKKMIESEINAQLRDKKYDLPKEANLYNVVIKGARFTDLGQGRLGLKASAKAEITQEQVAILINQQLKK